MTAKELCETFDYASERALSRDHEAIHVPADKLIACVTALRDEQGYDLLLDVTAIDWGMGTSPRFTGVYHLFHTKSIAYLRVSADATGDAENPVLPSLTDLYPAANWHERETYDMLGIHYEGHPDLRRILMWDGYNYYPLRKEFPLAGHETEMPEPDVVAATEGAINPTAAPMMGGPFVSPQTGNMSTREPRARDESWHETKPKGN